MSVSKQKLLFWANNEYNVCFSGKHGVGKTAQVKELFNELYGELGVDWLYFSASTMDPWVDFVGVPKEKVSDDGVTYLTLIRPEVFARDQVKAIFVDEFNRAPKKIRNAIMELLQFKSINGHKFHELKVIWTAINPPDEEETYDVEEIDPAQLDRFHIHVDIPYDVSKPYFITKYGKDDATAAIEWWHDLSDDLKDKVSPRRLDYVMDCYKRKGDIRDMLPTETNATKLLTLLSSGSIKEKLNKLFTERKDEETVKAFNDINFLAMANEIIINFSHYVEYFVPLYPEEQFSITLSKLKPKAFKSLVSSFPKDDDNITSRIDEIIKAESVSPTKIKVLESWLESASFPWLTSDDTSNAELLELLNTSLEEVNTQNTYHREKSWENIAEMFSSDKELFNNKSVLRTTYYYLFRSLDRTHQYTFDGKHFIAILRGVLNYGKKTFTLNEFIDEYPELISSATMIKAKNIKLVTSAMLK